MYGFNVELDQDFDSAIQQVTEALQSEGFGVLTEIDVSGTLKKKLDLDMQPYRILGACNPKLASQALAADPDIGMLLPCNVVVRQNEQGGVTVGFMDPQAVLGLVETPEVKQLAGEVRQRLERVAASLKG